MTFALVLDKETYLPRKVVFYTNPQDYKTYNLADIKINPKIDLESLKNPSLEGWNVKNSGPDPAVNSRFSSQLSLLLYLVRVWPR